MRAASKDEVLGVATKLAADVRTALGDNTSDDAYRFAMDTLSATSLDAVRDYAAGMVATSKGRHDEARQSFLKAVERDPTFGMGWTALAVAEYNLDRLQDAEQHIKQAQNNLGSMTERERYRMRGFYYGLTNDYPRCANEYAELVKRYAADTSARNNLALCLSQMRRMQDAVKEMRQLVTLLPNRVNYRENLALYESYAGDFQASAQTASAIQEPRVFGMLALAYSQLGQGQLTQALETYRKVGEIDAQGASYAAAGLGDLAIYEGRLSDAIRILKASAEKDLAEKEPDRAATSFAALAYAHMLRRQKGPAVVAAEAALKNSTSAKIEFQAARVFVEAGELAKARKLVAALTSELEAEPQSYAKLIEGEIALKNKDPRAAIKLFTEGNTLLDTWISRFDLGRAYLEADAFVQADSEFDRCITRRGEALSLFLDDWPTYGYLPTVYYYQGRVREALNDARFADSYRTYLNIRGKSPEDPLLPDVRRRAGQ
jgi:eukaryotic-like serine/threonine-protein kinase